jgi:hypothetical protein
MISGIEKNSKIKGKTKSSQRAKFGLQIGPAVGRAACLILAWPDTLGRMRP